MDKKKTVVIIGAGPTGLTAAYLLLKTTEMHPIIVERTDSVGGLAKSVYCNGCISDIGPHLYCTDKEQIRQIWDSLMPLQGAYAKDDIKLKKEFKLNATGLDPEEADDVMLRRDRCSRILYKGKYFSYPLSFTMETICKLGIFRTLYFGMGLLWVKVFPRRGDSLEDFLQNNFGLALYKSIFKGYTVKSWGRDPATISNASGTQRIVGISIIKALTGLLQSIFHIKKQPKIEQGVTIPINEVKEFFYPKLGSGSMWENMKKEILAMGGEIRFNETVTSIIVQDGNAQTVVTDGFAGEAKISADAIISTMAISDLFGALSNRGEIPDEVYDAAIKLPHRDVVAVTLVLKSLKIKNDTAIPTVNNLLPDCWSYVYNDAVQTNRFNIYNNFSPYCTPDGLDAIVLGMEYFCGVGDAIWERTSDELVEMAAQEAVILGLINKDALLFGTSIKCVKAYPGYFESYTQFEKIQSYLNSIDNLYFAGRNGQHKYFDMDQSMLSAMKCIESIIKNDRTIMWDVK